MKRLNLKNDLKLRTMQRVISIIWNRMDLFAKIFILAVLMGTSLPFEIMYAEEYTASQSNGKPYCNNNVWYSMFSSYTKEGSKDLDRKPEVFPPSGGNLTFEYWATDGVSWRQLYVFFTNDKSSWTDAYKSDKFYNGDNHRTFTQECPTDAIQISVRIGDQKYNTTAGTKHKTKDLKIPLAKHVRLYTGNADNSVGVIYTSRDFGNTIKIGSTDEKTINIRSFLGEGKIKMKVIARSGDAQSTTTVNNVFKIKYLGTVYTGEVDITGTGNVCGYPGAASNCTTSTSQSTPINTSLIPVVIEYHPNEAIARKAQLIFYDDKGTATTSDDVTYATVDLDGTGAKKTPTFNWKKTSMALDESAKSISDIVVMKESEATANISIEETTQTGGTQTEANKKLVIANGQVSIKEGSTTGPTYLKATYAGDSKYESATSVQEFTISAQQLIDRTITWTADFTGLRVGGSSIDLSTTQWKATTDPNGVSMDRYEVADPTIASVSGTTLTILKEGSTTITAIKNADNTYNKATMTKPLVVSSNSACNTIILYASPKAESDYTFNVTEKPKTIMWAVSTNDYKTAEGTVYLYSGSTKIDEREVTRDDYFPFQTILTEAQQSYRQFKVTGLKGWEAGAYGTRTLADVAVIMASTFGEIANNSIAFGAYDIASTKSLTPNVATYENIPDNITVEIVDVETGGNSTWQSFTFADGTHASTISTGKCGANNKGTASILINFTPIQVGDHKARLKVSAYDGNSADPVIFYIPITGSGKKITQTLTWENNPQHVIFTGTYNALSADLALTGAAKTSGVTTSAGALTIEYSSSNNDVATVVKDANEVQYIDFKKQGTFKLKANCKGNAVYDDAEEIESQTITVYRATPTITLSAPPNSINVFSTTTLTTSTFAGANISLTVTSKKDGTNPNASLSKSTNIAPEEAVTLTANTRTSSAGEGKITVVASVAQTDIYAAATSAAVEITAVEVTPLISWSGTEISTRQDAGKNITLSGTISNKTSVWTSDIVVTYTSNNNSIATTSGTTLTTVAAGITKINANVAAGVNNNAATPVSKELEVKLGAFGPTTLGEQSAGKAFIIDGGIFSGTRTITAPAEFKVSANGTDWYQDINLDLSTTKTFYVCFAPTTGTSTTAGALTKSGNITISGTTRTIPVSGTFAWPTKEFGSITIGSASASQNIELSNGTYNITVPEGYFVSADNSNWRQGNLTNVSITKYLYIKFQPNSGTTDYSNKTIVVTNNSGTIEIGVNGTSQANSIQISQSVGLAKDATFAMSNFTVVNSATASIDASKDYYISSEGGADPSKWSKSGVQITSGSTLYIKFQPSDNVADRTGDITITADGKDYIIHVAGTALTDAGTISNVSVGTSRWYGFSKSNETVGWYYFKNGRNTEKQFNKLDATFIVEGLSANPVVPATITMTDNANKLFALNDNDADIGYTKSMSSYTDIVRVSFSPRETTTSNVTSTIKISANNKTYTYTVSGSAQEQSFDFGEVEVGKASPYHEFSLSAFRPSWGATDNDFSISAVTNYLFSKDQTTWSKTLTFDNSAGWGDVFYVKFVPESVGDFGYTSFYIKDEGTSDRGSYKFNVKGTGAVSSVPQLTATVDSESDVQPFTMDNFTTEGTVTVTVKSGQDFYVSASNNKDFGNSVTLNNGVITFYVKQTAQNTVDTYYGTIEITDNATGRKYEIGASCKVNKKTNCTIIVPTRLSFISLEDPTHLLVGTGLQVHGSDQDMDNDIKLDIDSGGVVLLTTKATVSADKKSIIINKSNISNGNKIKVRAYFEGNSKVEATADEIFYIKYQTVDWEKNDSAWTLGTDGKWYILNIEDVQISSGSTTTDKQVSMYLPNVVVPSSKVKYNVRCGSEADCYYSTQLFYDELSDRKANIGQVYSNNYVKETSFSLPGKSDVAHLITLTNDFGGCRTESACWRCDRWGNTQDKFAKFEIELPQHYDVKQSEINANCGNVELGEVGYVDVPFAGLFKSFLTSGSGLTIEPATGCNTNIFFANPTSHDANFTLVPANNVISPYNKLSANAGLAVNNNQYYIRIYFKPNEVKSDYSGSFVLKDGETELVTITVSGAGITSDKEPQYIIWNQDLNGLPVSSSPVTLSATLSSGLSVSRYYKKSGDATIDVQNTDKLTFTSTGTATITAEQTTGGTMNGITYKAADPVDKIAVVTNTTSPTDCTGSLDVSSWNKSGNRTTYNVTASNNGAKELTGNYNVSAIKFTLSMPTDLSSGSVQFYLNGTSNTDTIGSTFTTLGTNTYTINLSGKNAGKGSKLYCSFSGTRTESGTISYTITDFTLYKAQEWTQIQTEDVDFGTQRVGQAGITRNIHVAKYSNFTGKIEANITGTNPNYFTIVGTNPITAACDTGIAAFDVRFIPLSAGDFSANLDVTNPNGGGTITIHLIGSAEKRNTKVSWEYAKTPIELNALGTGNIETLTDAQKGFLYDELRGESAKLSINPTYTVKNGNNDEVELLTGKTGQNIIKVNLGNDGNIASIEATGYGSGTAYVIASFNDNNHNIFKPTTEQQNCTLTVTVKKVNPTITFSPSNFSVEYPQDVTNGKDLTASISTGSDDVKWSYSDVSSLIGVTQKTKDGNVFTVTSKSSAGDASFTVKTTETAIYNAGSENASVKVNWGELIISVDASKLSLTSATHELALDNVSGLVTTNYPSGVSYTYFIKSGTGTTVKTASMDADNKKLTIKDIGTIELEVHGEHTGGAKDVESTGAVNVGIGTLIFDNNDGKGDGKWMTGENWAPHRDMVPDQTNFDAQISATCVIDKAASGSSDATNGIAKCHDLTIDAGTLNVSADCVLDVAGTINNTTASKFVLKASTTNSATVVFGAGNPDATIEMYFKGNTHEEFGGGYKNPEWQYRGIIGEQPSNWPANVQAYWWNEAKSGKNESCWEKVTDNSTLTSWTGYCMANMTDAPASYSYSTKLLPNYNATASTVMKEYELSYTTPTIVGDTMKNSGVNIFTNSFSAPICVADLTFENMDAQVWFFRSTYYLNWKKNRADSYEACPKKTCSEVKNCNDMIPAGHGFLVQATNGVISKLTITAGAINGNMASGEYKIPAAKETFNILEIKVSSDSIDDELFLLENENCSWRYDNGYDGTKMFADGLPQIYAQNKFGNTSINADSSMLGQFIGFRGIAEITEYEMKFNTDRLEGFTELYLFDHLTRRYADILAGGTYHFSAPAGDDPQRFQIMGRRDDDTYFTGEEQWIEVIGRQALLHGFDNESEPIYITDLMGKRVWTDNSKNGPWFDLPDLPAGVYIIHCGKATAKFVSK